MQRREGAQQLGPAAICRTSQWARRGDCCLLPPTKHCAVPSIPCSVAMCPHDSVEVRLRPPGVDLWTSQEATAGETALLLLLLGAVVLHRMPHLLLLAGADPSLLHSSSAPVACGLSLLVLTAPGALVWGAHTAAIKAGSLPGRGSLGSSESASAAAKPAPSFLTLSLAYVSGPGFGIQIWFDESSRDRGPG